MCRMHVGIGLSLLLLTGCYSRVRPEIDGLVCASANRPVDIIEDAEAAKVLANTQKSGDDLRLTSAQEPVKKTPMAPNLLDRLSVPAGVPGGEVAPIKLPDPTKVSKAEFKAAVNKYFPRLPPLGPDPQPVPGPEGRPLTLTDLQKMARENSPLLRQAAADVVAAKGAAIQAGAYPNPTAGVQSATASNSGGPTYGIMLGQTITTMGKKKLAEAAAIMDLENMQLAYRRAEADLMASIRSGYFQVLVAQENIKASRALVNLTDEVYKVNVDQVGGGDAAPYEPMQVAVFAAQARQGLIVARNSFTLAWKQLASNIGIRGMQPTQLVGRIDMPLPRFDYTDVLAHVLTNHTEVASATMTAQKARYNLRLAEVTAIPDVTVQTSLLQDNTLGISNRLVAGVQATVPVPVWDRNLGGIQQARGALVRAVEEQHRVRDSLTARVADAFRRYDESRDIIELYRIDILPKQVQAFRATVSRHYGGEIGRVAYTDLIVSEQNLVSVIGPYLTALAAQWQAVVDVAALLQTEDLFQTQGTWPPAPVPDLEHLLQLPCCHPCSALPGAVAPDSNDTWPRAGFAAPAEPLPTLPAPRPANQGKANQRSFNVPAQPPVVEFDRQPLPRFGPPRGVE
jgi:cobalt-zinc-cadmium efflux system outer membrane protein